MFRLVHIMERGRVLNKTVEMVCITTAVRRKNTDDVPFNLIYSVMARLHLLAGFSARSLSLTVGVSLMSKEDIGGLSNRFY